MKMNDIYIKQMNQFCDANCKVSAEDILARAKQRQTDGIDNNTDSKLLSFDKKKEKTNLTTDKTNHKKVKRNKKTAFIKFAQAAAACLGIFLLSGTTVLAVNGDLESFIRSIFTDETTAELISEGHVYEINDYQECGDFALNLVAISGDRDNPQIIMDVYLNDETLAAANDRIYLSAYVLDKETYENEEKRAEYSPCGGYGTKDSEIANLYHVTFRGAPAWLMSGNEALIAVQEIFTDISPKETGDLSYWTMRDNSGFDLGEPAFTIHEIGYEYRVTVPEDIFAGITTRRYHSVTLEGRNYDFILESVEYGYYNSTFTFYLEDPEGIAPANEDEKSAIENQLYMDWLRIGTNITVTVDGTEYKFGPDGNLGSVNWNYNGTTNNLKRGYIYATLPVINYFESESITLEFNDQVIDLKEAE